MNVYKIVLHIHRLRQMTRVALTKNMADTRVSSRELAYAYQKFVTEISRSETSGTIMTWRMTLHFAMFAFTRV